MKFRTVLNVGSVLVLFLLSTSAFGQQVHTQPLTLTPVPNSINTYTNGFGDKFIVTPQDGGSLCDPSGCMVQVCQGKGPCQYYYCTVNKCVKITPQAIIDPKTN